jgi:hypothetical protein
MAGLSVITFFFLCACLLAKALGITDTIEDCRTISFVTMAMAQLAENLTEKHDFVVFNVYIPRKDRLEEPFWQT